MSAIKSGFRSLMDACKKNAWRVITPVFPYVRDGLLELGIIHHTGRQKYPLGWIRHGKNKQELIEHLARNGFSNHFVAWVDADESVSLRKCDGFHSQYHLRIFNDGEVRGHYERTPEAYPFAHFLERMMEARREEFLEILEEWIDISADTVSAERVTIGKTASSRAPAASRGVPLKG